MTWAQSLITYPRYKYGLIGTELYLLGIIVKDEFATPITHRSDDKIKEFLSNAYLGQYVTK